MDASRIARVVVKDGSGAWLRIGSGYRVSSTAILTAAHVLGDAKSESVEVSLDVGGDGEWTSPVLDLWTSPGDADIGVVAIDATEDEGITPALFGRVSRDRDAVLGFTAAGFPRWKLRDDDESGPFRDLEQAHGYVPVLSNRREGTLGLELDGPPGRDPEPEHSPWEGMSGAAVLVGDRVVGIVAE
ncbi:MAG TPA: trypsin-like peptidase domain-containing protein, partial [Actinomycetota bacterium]|nr:trypsin-like peptidase domain-containing protein [Actinomycetota bacterium]